MGSASGLQSLGIAAALATIAGFFLAMNVTLSLSGANFDLSFTFFGAMPYSFLGGFASYGGVVVGAVLLSALTEGLRFLDLPLSAGQAGSLRFIIVNPVLIGLSTHLPAEPASGASSRNAALRMTIDFDSRRADPRRRRSDQTLRHLRAVDRASFTVARRSITALIGPNGRPARRRCSTSISGYDRPAISNETRTLAEAARGSSDRRPRQPSRRTPVDCAHLPTHASLRRRRACATT